MRKWTLALVLATAVLASSCGAFSSLFKTVTITGVSWASENIPADFWNPDGLKDGCYMDFWIYYEESSLTASDVKTATISLPDGSRWSLVPEDDLNTKQGFIGGWSRFYDTTDDRATLPLGQYTAEIVLENGKKDSFVFNVTEPGQNSSSHGFVALEDFPLGSDGVATLARPTQVAASSDAAASTITVSFSQADARAMDGYVAFYDASENYVGSSPQFYDYRNGAYYPRLNGNGYWNIGSNTVVVPLADLAFVTGYAFPDITTARVVTRDGKQYSPAGSNYDYTSRSTSASVVAQ